MSLPRFLVVLFPLACGWRHGWPRHPRAQRPALVGSAAADGVLRRPVRHLALGGVGGWTSGTDVEPPAPSPRRAHLARGRPLEPAARGARRRRLAGVDGAGGAVGGLVLAAVGGLIVDIPRAAFGVKHHRLAHARRGWRSPTRSCRTSASCCGGVLRADGRAQGARLAVRPAPPGRRLAGGRLLLVLLLVAFLVFSVDLVGCSSIRKRRRCSNSSGRTKARRCCC